MQVINVQQRVREKYDHINISQMLIQLAAPWKPTIPEHGIKTIEEVVDEVVCRKYYFEGSKEQEGEHRKIIKDLLKTDKEIEAIYTIRERFNTQFEKVSTLIKHIGEEEFSKKNLNNRFDKDTAATVRQLYLNVKKKEKEIKNQKKCKKKNKTTGGLTGIVEEMTKEPINVDFLLKPPKKNVSKFPFGFGVKYGKNGMSASTKIGEYVANTITHFYEKKLKNITTSNFDPYMSIAYILDKGKNCLEEQVITKLFDTKNNTQVRDELEELITINKQVTTASEKKKLDQGELIEKKKRMNTLNKQLTQIAADNTKLITREEQEHLMKELYLSVGKLEDVRGIQIIRYEGTGGFPSLTNSPYYKEGTGEVHTQEENNRVYASEHAKWQSRMLKNVSPNRWEKHKENKTLELQKLDLSGLLLDLLGPDNKQKYVMTKKNTKYDFSKQQEAFWKSMSSRMKAVIIPIDTEVQALHNILENNPDEKNYELELRKAAKRIHNSLYKG